MTTSAKYISLLDVPDPCSKTETPKVFFQYEDQAIEVPNILYKNSIWLQTTGDVFQNNIVPVEHLCFKNECKEIVNTIEELKYLQPENFIPFIKLCNYLQVNDELIEKFVPFIYLNSYNAPTSCPVLYTLIKMDRYKDLAKSIIRRQLRLRIKEADLQNYCTFKHVVKGYCWNSRGDYD